jgi:hypothetical protein
MSQPTHKITFAIVGKYPHGATQDVSVAISGNGDLGHMVEAFKTALVASGYSLDTAAKLDDIFSQP